MDSKRLRILYHHRTMGRGAEGLHIRHIVEAFEALGHEVDILSPPGIDPRRDAGSSPVDMTKVKTRGMMSFWKTISMHTPQFCFELIELCYNLWALPKLLTAHRRRPYDFVYERHAMFLMAGTWFSRLSKVPLFLEVNEVSGPKRARSQAFRGLAGTVERFVFSRATRVFTVSSFLENKIAERIGSHDSLQVVPNAIHPRDYEQSFSGKEVREKLGLNGKIVLGFAGWFSEWDRLDFLIETFAQLRMETGREDLHLMLVGDGPVVPQAREQARRLDIENFILFTGPIPRSEVLDYLDAIDIAVLPSSNEFGSPMVLFELLALGKAVAAPALMPILDVIDDGTNGLIFQPLSSSELLQAMKTLVADEEKRAAMGRMARERVLQRHTWEANVRLILNHYGMLENA